jgi:DNA topoisomerase-1
LKELGDGVKVMSGRFGPYVTDGKTNANVPKGSEPTALTLEQAKALLAERAAKGGGKAKRPARAAKAEKAPAKKAPAKKPAAKRKAAAKKTA